MVERFAVFALVDAASAREIRREQTRLAEWVGDSTVLRFPVHVTLRGRFWAERGAACRAFNTLVGDVRQLGLHRISVELSAARIVDGRWVWREVPREAIASKVLSAAHEQAEAATAAIMTRDEVLAGHRGDGLRPHVTLGWNVTPERWQAYEARQADSSPAVVRLVALGLGSYPAAWPEGSAEVRLVEVATLSEV